MTVDPTARMTRALYLTLRAHAILPPDRGRLTLLEDEIPLIACDLLHRLDEETRS